MFLDRFGFIRAIGSRICSFDPPIGCLNRCSRDRKGAYLLFMLFILKGGVMVKYDMLRTLDHPPTPATLWAHE